MRMIGAMSSIERSRSVGPNATWLVGVATMSAADLGPGASTLTASQRSAPVPRAEIDGAGAAVGRRSESSGAVSASSASALSARAASESASTLPLVSVTTR